MLKKIKFLLIVSLSVFLLVACSNGDGESDSYDETETTQQDNETEADQQTDNSERGPFGLPLIHLTEEARDIVLEDFDYLATFILENAPTVEIAYRRLGTSLSDLLDSHRERIEQMEPVESFSSMLLENRFDENQTDVRDIAADYLFSVLIELGILELEGLGHMMPRVTEEFIMLLEMQSVMLHLFENDPDQMIQFIRDVDPTLADTTNEEILDEFATYLIPRIEAFLEIYTNSNSLWFYDVDLDADLDFEMNPFAGGMEEEGNVTTEILEEGSIAYLHIQSFMNSPVFDSNVLFPFYEEVQDFDHLIIDIRGNMGGLANYPPGFIITMLIDEPLEFRHYEFFTSGAAALQQAEFGPLQAEMGESTVETMSIDAFIQDRNLPYLNADDIELLSYATVSEVTLFPREDNIPFSGEIWILVDEHSASASEMLAAISMDSEFATVVGTNTMAISGVMHAYVSLPNTGIIFRVDTGYTIDSYGRSFEEFGVTPDIVISPDGDALEEVLSLIQ